MDNKVILLGGGGHTKVVIAMLRVRGYQPIAVLDDAEDLWGSEILGVPITGAIESIKSQPFNWAVIGIGDNHVRRTFVRTLDLPWLTVVHPMAWVDVSVVLGMGTVVFAGAVIQPGTVLGEHVIINTSASVDHDCRVGDFVHIAPGTHLAGSVRIGEGTFMGVNSAAIPGIQVGAWSTIGAGAVVVRNIPDSVTAYGVPATVRSAIGKVPAANKGRSSMLSVQDTKEWLEFLTKIPVHDFYHRPEYHALEEQLSGAAAYLFTYSRGDFHAAVPILLRSIGAGDRLERFADQWCDASSVYGYVGPVSSHLTLPPEVVTSFQETLNEALKEMEVVSLFSRLHPLFPQQHLLRGLGECKLIGKTVSIDLTQRLDEQRRKFRKGHRTDLIKNRKRGVRCKEDTDLSYLPQFVGLYRDNMKRINADQSYYFDRPYFDKLISALNDRIHLFVALLGDEVIAGALVVECNGLVQYHLGASNTPSNALAPMKSVLDAVRIWGTERGCHTFHLGGGVGAREDSLMYFKSGFSDLRHDFCTWEWIILPEIYESLCEARAKDEEKNGLVIRSNFFPAYRAAVSVGL